MGVRITQVQNENLAKTPLKMTYNGAEVSLASNTSILDYGMAKYVLRKSEEMGCTLPDFYYYLECKRHQQLTTTEESNSHEIYIDDDDNMEEKNSAEDPTFAGYRQNAKFLSPIARRLQVEIEESHKSDAWSHSQCTSTGEFDLMTEDSKDEVRKRIITSLDCVLSSSRMPAAYIRRFEAGVLRMLKTVDADIAAFKTKLFEELKDNYSGMNSHEKTTTYEFACDEEKSSHKGKRKRNALDF